MPNTVDCIERLQAAADQLLAEGAEPYSVIAALAEIAVRTGQLDGEAGAPALDGLAVVAIATAQAMRDRKAMEGLREILQS